MIERSRCAFIVLSLAVMLVTRGVRAADDIVLTTPTFKMRINPAGFRYGFERSDGTLSLGAHAQSGLQLGKGDDGAADVTEAKIQSKSDTEATFVVKTSNGISARVTVKLMPHRAV